MEPLTTSPIHQRILQNLTGRAYPLPGAAALIGVDNYIDGLRALDELTRDRLIILTHELVQGIEVAHYTLNHYNRPNNKPNLKIVS